MDKKIFQLHIALKGIEPKIWRRVLVPADYELEDLHDIIQVLMDWTDEHLHQFIKDTTFFTDEGEEVEEWDATYFSTSVRKEYAYFNIKISDLLANIDDTLFYEYDFGDSWLHEIILEKILQADTSIKYPLCTGGERNTPPEDCGGLPGYFDLIAAYREPNNPKYKEIRDWYDDVFDPEFIDIEDINSELIEIMDSEV